MASTSGVAEAATRSLLMSIRRTVIHCGSMYVNPGNYQDGFGAASAPGGSLKGFTWIDPAQPPFAVLIVGVFAAIAVARSPGHHLCYRRPFPGEQEPVLILESLQAVRCDVVFGAVGFLRERLAHAAMISTFQPLS